ncbi:CHD8 isoform 5, partial [Pan troglodytes]
IDLVCQAVLSGKWPSSRRSQEMVTGGILGPGNHLLDSPSLTPGEYGDSPVPTPRSSSAASMAEEEASAVSTAAAQFTKLRRGMDEKEFTVQIKDEEGLKLTFQKHKLMANGVMGDGHPLFHKKKGNRKKLVEYMEDRRKQKWQRCKKNNKAELNCLGMEPVQTANSRNGKKGHHTETVFNRVLPGPIAPESSKKRARRMRPDLSKMMALMQGGSTGSLSLHNTFQH